MVFDSVYSHRLKRAVTNMQSDLGDFDSTRAQAVKQLGSEMQSRSRRRNRAPLARKDGLIAFGVKAVFFIAFDVRRKRSAADTIYDLVEVSFSFETDHAAAEITPFDHLSGELAACELDSRAWQQRFARLYQRFPNQRLDATHEKNFDAPTKHRLAAHSLPDSSSDQPCRKDSRVVENEQVAGIEVIGQLRKHRIDKRTGCAIDDHQPRHISSLGGLLRDKALWKLVIKFRDKHGNDA